MADFTASDFSQIGASITALGSYSSSISAGVASAGAYNVSAEQSERLAEFAYKEAETNNLKLQRLFNETAASQAATFAAQGRSFSSGTIQNIIASDQADLEWDMAYNTEVATDKAEGYMEDAENFRRAGSEAKSSSKTSATLGLLGSVASIASSFY